MSAKASDDGVHELREVINTKTFDRSRTTESGKHSGRDVADNEHLARIGKKAVLKVRK